MKFTAGDIEARGKKDGKVALVERRQTTGDPVSIRLTPDREEINADGEDIALIKVEVLDKEGRPVPTARNPAGFNVSGAGRLIGVGNGDPNCLESDKGSIRSVFSGLAQIIIQSNREPGEIHIEAVKEGEDETALTPAKIVIKSKKAARRPSVS